MARERERVAAAVLTDPGFVAGDPVCYVPGDPNGRTGLVPSCAKAPPTAFSGSRREMGMMDWQLFLRIVVAAILGGVIGLERDRRGRPAGLRTHMIVALAAASYMVVSTQFIEHQRYGPNEHVEVDVSRIAASIVTGIGFLGGGAIMRTGFNVQGLTTAACLWLVGAIGMAAGGGMYSTAVFVTALGLISLTLLRRFEDKDDNIDVRRVQVELRDTPSLDQVLASLAAVGAQASVVNSERILSGDRLLASLEVRTPRNVTHQMLLDALSPCPGLERSRVDRGEG